MTSPLKDIDRMVAASNEALLQAERVIAEQAHEEGLRLDVIVGGGVPDSDRWSSLAKFAPSGLYVASFSNWLSQTWGLLGDGRTLINSAQRFVLVSSLVRQLGPSEVSAGLIEMLAQALTELVIYAEDAEKKPLSEQQKRVMTLVDRYMEELESRGLVENSQACRYLSSMDLPERFYLFEDASTLPVYAQEFIASIGGASARVFFVDASEVLSPGSGVSGDRPSELASLHEKLFTGRGEVNPSGAVLLVEACGFHARAASITETITRITEQGTAPEDIALATKDAAGFYPHVYTAFYDAEIPFAARFTKQMRDTAFGAALIDSLELASVRATEDADDLRSLRSLVASPCSGLSFEDSLALRTRWRKRGGSTPAARAKDFDRSFSNGIKTPEWLERTSAFKAVLTAAAQVHEAKGVEEWSEALQTLSGCLYANLVASDASEPVLIEARACCSAVYGLFDVALDLDIVPDIGQIESLSVAVIISNGDVEHAVTIDTPQHLRAKCFDWIVMCDLEADTYPMVKRPSSFESLLSHFRPSAPDNTSLSQRRLMLDLIDAADAGIAFLRVCNDETGVMRRQSALWDELACAYNLTECQVSSTLAELKKGRPGAAIASKGWAFCIGEDEVLGFEREQPDATEVPYRQGVLEWDESVPLLLPQGEGDAISPTALENCYRCPYGWFTSKRISTRDIDGGFNNMVKGNVAHAVLDAFYVQLHEMGIQRVLPENLPVALDLLGNVYGETVSKMKRRGQISALSQREEHELSTVVEELAVFIERDADFLPDFSPTYTELSLGYGTDESPLLQYAGMNVRGKVDRIDVNEKGQAVIIDYKLSGLSTGYGLALSDSLPERIQTDIYATLVTRHFEAMGKPLEVIGSVYRSYTHNMLRGVYSAAIDDWGGVEVFKERDKLPRIDVKNAEDMVNYPRYLEQVEEEVAARLAEIGAGDIAINPLSDDCCTYCAAVNICPKRSRS